MLLKLVEIDMDSWQMSAVGVSTSFHMFTLFSEKRVIGVDGLLCACFYIVDV